MAKIFFKLDDRRPVADGTFPLKIVVSHNSQTATLNTGLYMTAEGWEEMRKGLDGRRRLSARERIVNERKAKMEKALIRLELDGVLTSMSASELKKKLETMAADKNTWYDEIPATSNPAEKDLFVPYYIEQIELKEKQGTKDIYAWTLKLITRFEEQNGRSVDELRFSDITPAWLLAFDEWMSPTNGVNSRSKNMRNIRSVFNAAIEDGRKVDYPFSRSSAKRSGRLNDGKKKFKIKTNFHTTHKALTIKQLILLRDYPCEKHQEQYRDMFMLMFYLIGINAVDLLTARPSQLVNGRLEYDREKTGRPYSIKVEPEAMAIIKKYKGKNYLLSPCDRYKDYRNYLHHLNDQLKLIGVEYRPRQKKTGEGLFPKLATYWARHTWASIAINNDIIKDVVGKALGHSWALDSVTDIYINMDTRIVDRANRRVLDLLKNIPAADNVE